jgi:prepilin-type N-terminal cleavage/methylation domain-containing protein
MERTAYMITFTTHIEYPFKPKEQLPSGNPIARRLGFTLIEILIGLSLSSAVLASVFSACLMMSRSGMSAIHYSVSESELRRGLEEFSQDVRMARAIRWNSATSITLVVPDNYTTTSNMVTYAWDNSSSGPTALSFYRKPGDAAATNARTVYVRAVSSFSFSRFNRQNAAATTDAATKRVQITIGVARSRSTLVAATTRIVTASYTLRNKVIN